MGLFSKKKDGGFISVGPLKVYSKSVGMVWFIDGHTENILSYSENCEGTIFFTESGKYKYMRPLDFYKYERMGDPVFCDSVYALVEVPRTDIYKIEFWKGVDHEDDSI